MLKPDFNSIKPGFNPNRYKFLTSFSEPYAHSLTSFACANNYKSHIFIQSTSAKSLNLWDVSTNQIFSTFTDAHSRWIHNISLADYKFVPSTFENLFLTTAVTDGIKSWDIRNKKPIMNLTGHVNRASPIKCAFSPCGRYIGTGSEVLNEILIFRTAMYIFMIFARVRSWPSQTLSIPALCSHWHFHPLIQN